MKTTTIFIALALVLGIISCKKDQTESILKKETVNQSVINFESLGEVTVNTYQNEQGQLIVDYGNHQKEVEAFFNANPDHITLINHEGNGKSEIAIIKSEKSQLFPKTESLDEVNDNPNQTRSGFHYTVTFYDDNFYSDRYLRIHKISNHYDSDLKNTYSTSPFKKGFNDKTSSFKMKAPVHKKLRVILYDDKNFKDTKIIITVAKNIQFQVPDLNYVYAITFNQTNKITTNYSNSAGTNIVPKFNDKLSSFIIQTVN